jgi:hypothetical protein
MESRQTLDSNESQWQKPNGTPSDFAGLRWFSSTVSASILTSVTAAEALKSMKADIGQK